MSLKLGTQDIAGISQNKICNAHFLLEAIWSDHIINDISFLRADTFSWQPGGTYTVVYNHLVQDIQGITAETETIGSYTVTFYRATDGHKICLADQEQIILNIYNDSGVAWYYILDITNQRFKLPRENPEREVLGKSSPVVGNGLTLGLTDGTNNYGLYHRHEYGAFNGTINNYGKNVGSTSTGSGASFDGTYGITTDPTKSGLIAQLSDITGVYKGKQYLYFYVGDYSQTAIEQTAGLNSELLNGKADVDLTNINASCAPIDGQWVGSNLALINTDTSITSGTTSTFSLSSYLPNDDYKYEVMFSVIGCSAATSGRRFKLCVGSSIIDVNRNIIAAAISRSNANYWCANNTIIPIGTDRNVYLKNVATDDGTVFEFYASGYRRIGTNA